jgi:hypothetical protein
MSFARNLENNLKNSDKEHLPKDLVMPIHQHGSFKNDLVLPPMNSFHQIRSKPQSGFNQTTLISNAGQLDYHLNSAGYISHLKLEMEFTISTAAVTLIPAYLIDRVEIMSSENNIISTIYGDVIYLEKVHQTLEEHTRTRTVEGLTAGYDGTAYAVGSYRVVFKIPTFIDQTQLKLNAIREKLLVRIYFSSLGVVAGTAANISVTLCDVLQKGVQLSNTLESLEISRKMKAEHKFRFLNPVRAASQTLAMAASSQYDIRLTSANNLSAFLLFVVRAAPLTTNINTFVAIDKFQLLDQDNVIQSIEISNENHKWLTKAFDGDIFNFKNIYCVPFAESIKDSLNGGQTGFYSMTSNEILRIYTSGTFTPGSYRIDVYSWDHNKLTLCGGNLQVSK